MEANHKLLHSTAQPEPVDAFNVKTHVQSHVKKSLKVLGKRLRKKRFGPLEKRMETLKGDMKDIRSMVSTYGDRLQEVELV